MVLIPHFVQNEINAASAILLSAFNFCNPFDTVLPFSTGTVSDLDMQHLWGMYTGIAAGSSGGAVSLRWLRIRRRS